MGRTRYERHNGQFSDRAHEAAKQLIYPVIFDGAELEFQSTMLHDGKEGQRRDGEQGIDRIISVIGPNSKFKQPLKFTIQERFRRLKYHDKKDITITEWNHASGKPSELYKIEADYFVYGYYSEPSCPKCGEPLSYGERCKRGVTNSFSGKTELCNGKSMDIEPCFWQWKIINVAELKLGLVHNELEYTVEKNKKKQSFLCVTFKALDKRRLIVAEGGTKNGITATRSIPYEQSSFTLITEADQF